MAFAYDAGSTLPSPFQTGRIEFGGIVFGDGSFRSDGFPPLTDSAPMRVATFDLPSDDGGVWGQPFLTGWQFDFGSLLVVADPADLADGMKYLRDRINKTIGQQLIYFQDVGWAERRQMLVAVSGQVEQAPPSRSRRIVAGREITIPLFAADPRAYNADTEQVVAIAKSATENLTNNGNEPAPFVARFTGPLTNPSLEGPGVAGTNRLRLGNTDLSDYVIASGHYVDVQTNPAAPGGVTALDDTGTSVWAQVANSTGRLIAPGTSAWTFSTADAGDTGHVTVTFRDTWGG